MMFNNIDKEIKQLDLSERTQSGATGIYNTKGIPPGNAMPNYTQTQTAEKINFSISEQRESDTIIRELLSITPKENGLLFEVFQNKYNDEIYHHITELMLWAATTEHNQDAPLTVADYDRKISEERGRLKDMDDTLPVESYFRQGANDTAKCGQLLIIKLRVWSEDKQIYAIELLSGIQWLIREKEKLMAATPSQKEGEEEKNNVPMQEEITFSDALKTLVITYLKLNSGGRNVEVGKKSWNKTRMIVALMHVLESRGTLPTCSETEYAQLIASIIGQDSENLRKGISNHQQAIKPYGCTLKMLNENYIKAHQSDDSKAMTSKEYKQYWAGMFELIDGFIDKMDDLSPLRGNSAKNPA